MNTNIKSKKCGVNTIYIVSGVITWPIVTAVIYWGDRITNDLPGLASASQSASPSIGFWAAGGYALLVSVSIVVAGWIQSEMKS